MSLAGIEGATEFPAGPPPTGLVSCEVMQLPVTVSGQDLKGIAFVDNCKTVAIAHNGAIVTIERTLGADQELFLRYETRERLARVISHSEASNYGLCFTKNDPQFWGTAVTSCDGIAQDGPLNDFNNDPPTGTDPLLVPNYEEFENSMPVKSAVRTTERRRSPRIALRQAKACVEVPGAQPDVVELINISRGGLCFRSQRVYPVAGLILVAAPYTHGGTNLFVTGRIVRINRDAWGGLYGVEYVR